MGLIKKIDSYLLKTFLGLLAMTFMICIFILLMQFVWMHVKDLVGKGVEVNVLAEFFIYAVASVVPLALPLAILLASLMSFGNLGEKTELTAMKAAGISLFRIMRPLTISIMFICGGAFLFSNYVLPVSQVKLWALIFSLRQKSPELEIPQGEFYDGIDGYNIYVRHKDPQKGMLYDMMIYDYSEGFQNATVMVADSGQLFFTEDNKHLLLRLYSGESFENLDRQQKRATQSEKNIPYRRESFTMKQMLIDFDMEFNRYDESVLKDQHVSKNVGELVQSIDSVQILAHDRSAEQSAVIVDSRYFGRERQSGRDLESEALGAPSNRVYHLDSLLASMSAEDRHRSASAALEKAKAQRDQVDYNALMLDDYQRYIRRHEIELHRKFTLAFACLVFFFIGAPLGAITRKGGLGMPVVISVVMFIIYYIIDNTGYKMAREALWPCWAGMWLSSMVLLPIGIFLTYKAATDSALFNPEAWIKIFGKLKRFIYKIWKQLRKQLKIFAKANS
jgi:lipopolysaccharide export system permease protein